MRKIKKINKPEKPESPKWLPDWKDEKQYLKPWNPIVYAKGKIEKKSSEPPKEYRWAWEFLRRNEDYQKDMEDMLSVAKSLPLEAAKLNQKIAKKYLVNPGAVMPHPNDDFPINLNHIFDRTTPRILSGLGVQQLERHREYWVPGTRRIDMGVKGLEFVPREYSEFAVMFDLKLPLKAQIDKAYKILSTEAKAFKKSKHTDLAAIKPPIFRLPNDKILLRYLRILDAKIMSVLTAEIASLLFKRGDVDSKERMVKEDHAIAKEYRDSKKYSYIAMSHKK